MGTSSSPISKTSSLQQQASQVLQVMGELAFVSFTLLLARILGHCPMGEVAAFMNERCALGQRP
jgi:hypothetical protein